MDAPKEHQQSDRIVGAIPLIGQVRDSIWRLFYTIPTDAGHLAWIERFILFQDAPCLREMGAAPGLYAFQKNNSNLAPLINTGKSTSARFPLSSEVGLGSRSLHQALKLGRGVFRWPIRTRPGGQRTLTFSLDERRGNETYEN